MNKKFNERKISKCLDSKPKVISDFSLLLPHHIARQKKRRILTQKNKDKREEEERTFEQFFFLRYRLFSARQGDKNDEAAVRFECPFDGQFSWLGVGSRSGVGVGSKRSVLDSFMDHLNSFNYGGFIPSSHLKKWVQSEFEQMELIACYSLKKFALLFRWMMLWQFFFPVPTCDYDHRFGFFFLVNASVS